MSKIIQRILSNRFPDDKTVFLWGPRKVGKSFWLNQWIPKTSVISLLETEVFAEFASRPSLLRERVRMIPGRIAIDEIQKIPALLDEVHRSIEEEGRSFILTGSSARKLNRAQANLLGGRAWRRVLLPLTLSEIAPDQDLECLLVCGLLPSHYLAEAPIEEHRAYVQDYLKEEIASEGDARNLPSFSKFLKVAAQTCGDLLNYTRVASDCEVSARVVRGYFDILEDTFLGFRLPPFGMAKERRLIQTEKFYLFDVGVAGYLSRRNPVLGSSDFGKAFEHLIFMELRAYQAYRNPELDLSFWRTSTGLEVDAVLGEGEVSIEIKGSSNVRNTELNGLHAFREEWKPRIRKQIVVSLEKKPRKLESGIEILPWFDFVQALWAGEY